MSCHVIKNACNSIGNLFVENWKKINSIHNCFHCPVYQFYIFTFKNVYFILSENFALAKQWTWEQQNWIFLVWFLWVLFAFGSDMKRDCPHMNGRVWVVFLCFRNILMYSNKPCHRFPTEDRRDPTLQIYYSITFIQSGQGTIWDERKITLAVIREKSPYRALRIS